MMPMECLMNDKDGLLHPKRVMLDFSLTRCVGVVDDHGRNGIPAEGKADSSSVRIERVEEANLREAKNKKVSHGSTAEL